MVSGREASRSFQFWAIGLGGFLVASAVNGAIPHVPTILIEHGGRLVDFATADHPYR